MKSCQICPARIARTDTEEVTLKNQYNADWQVHIKICPECRRKLQMVCDGLKVTISPSET